MIKIEEYKGVSKKTGKEFKCFKLTVGEWERLIFVNSKFEYDYIKGILNGKQG